MIHRCSILSCGVEAKDGFVIAPCSQCTFDFCEEHRTTVDGALVCDVCYKLMTKEKAVAKIIGPIDQGEKRLLVYLETRCVDYLGVIDPRHVNRDDRNTIARWENDGYLLPVPGRDVVRLSDQAWADAHAERKARYERSVTPVKPL